MNYMQDLKENVLKLIERFNRFNDGEYIIINDPAVCNYKGDIYIMANGIKRMDVYEDRYEPAFLLMWSIEEYDNYSDGYLDTDTAIEVKASGLYDIINEVII